MIYALALFALLVKSSSSLIVCDGDCGGLCFFGEDRNENATMNDALPLDSTPKSDDARDEFFSAIVNPVTEDLETATLGDTNPTLDFGGAGTASLAGGSIRADPPLNGQYAISPVQYFSTNESFRLSFSSAISALGFYGSDIGDVNGILNVSFIQPDTSSCSILIPHEVDGPSGGVLYFGYIDLFFPFVEVVFSNSNNKRDRFAFDDFTIAERDSLVLCLDGVTNTDGSICCDGGCGVCGGCDCDLNPGGAALCCPGEIASSGFECMLASDVACILGEYTPVDVSECLF